MGLTDQIEVDRGGNRLIVVTSPRIISEIEEIVAEMDKPARQVMLEARIIEVSTNDAKKIRRRLGPAQRQGTVFVEGTYSSISGTFTDPTKLGNLQTVPNTPGSYDIFKFRNFTRLPFSFPAFLDLMIQNGSARVLASPKLATLNGKAATMLVGQRIPFVVSQTVFAGSAAAPTTSIQKEEVGIKLAVTPLINADGWITTNDRARGQFPSPASTARTQDLPVIANAPGVEPRYAMRDSSTVIIAGLLNTSRPPTRRACRCWATFPGWASSSATPP